MKGCYLEKWLLVCSVFYALFSSNQSVAQVVGDTTLPTGERSQVTGNPNFQIDGGATRGGNLFHSFSEFSVPTGGSAFFNNAADVQNILTRVTGGTISNIDGLIQANGTANLFVINPNGIIFGLNSRLDVGGSFVASTASSIKFADGTEFNAVNPSAPPLLTISVPIGLQFNGTEGDIVVQGSNQTPAPDNPFTEVGDAGQLPDTAQAVNSATDGTSFNAISGNLNNSNDVDLYQLFLTQGQLFTASTVDGTTVDTQLFLFDGSGLGLSSNDDSANTLQSTVPLNEPFIPAASGTYYLGISSYDNDPRSPQGYIFGASGEPNDPGSGLPVSEWVATNSPSSGTYTITLNPQPDTPTLSPPREGLQVQPGKTLALVGGNVTIQGENLQAPGGRVELGGVAGSGTVGLNVDGNNIGLSFPDGVVLSDVSLSNSALIDVRAGGSGSIAVTAGNLTLNQGSLLRAGINIGLGFAGAQAGDIQLDATEALNLADGSGINNEVSVGGTGNAGNINITTGSLSLTGSAFLLTTTRGQGNTGSVNINARDTVSLDGINTAIFNSVYETGVGNAGDINITTGSLSLTRGASLASGISGQGDIGRVNINARDTVSLDGENADVLPSAIFSIVLSGGVGNAGGINIQAQQLILRSNAALIGDVEPAGRGRGGDINLNISGTILLLGGTTADTGESARITLGVQPDGVGSGANLRIRAGSLVLQDGGLIKASTQGQGDAGNIDIRADVVDISGSVPTSGLPSGLFTSSDTAGNAGDITIHTQTFRIADGATLSARSRGDGQGGDITVNAVRTFEAVNGGQLITTTFGQGRAGNITVNAGEQITIAGSDPNYTARLAKFPNPVEPYVANAISETGSASGLFANTEPNSVGRGGDIQIATGRLIVQEGARMITSTAGSERAGDITVSASDIQLSSAASGLFAQTTTSANAGNLTIQPRSNGQSVRVNLQDGAQISASTSSSGNGGQLTLTAPESITLTGNGSIIAAETGGSGTGGNLNLQTGTLNIQNQAQVTVSSSGAGSAGSLFVDANQIYLDNGGKIRADTSGGGGDINLRSSLILLRNGSSITTNATGSNILGGDINIDTDNLVAAPKENSDISANSANFRGGNVTVRADGIFGIEFQEQLTPLSDITATGVTSEFSGTVNLLTPGIDPSRGLAELPTEVVDATGAISTGCRGVQGSSFVVTGRGGLPPTPQQALGDDPRWRDWRTPDGVSRQPNAAGNGTLPPSANLPSTKSALVEATGWVIEPDGKVILTASVPNVTSPNRWGEPVNCDGS
ncbi:filamentous hemagglutinin N-terminal domain-containing protein [Microcoleus sp. FACHB-SPT15]|uniref:two-partner secretion domain-containing protein n=1 Tax=Microcoleus sp. FACHB-SPT15 TaxID=2692830 RepID=UPI00177DAF04|nr:filamentous hemagglutinin N-terminal domain-containing protein [Microcoleus sp. FACHB-SPT15]MBD1810030.1 filamentous hemagglutinin N-terminal domain-containing protein [Microcoleus sp. FACHB-SPT15]